MKSNNIQPSLFDDELEASTPAIVTKTPNKQEYSMLQDCLKIIRTAPSLWYYPWLPFDDKNLSNALYMYGDKEVPPIWNNDARQVIILLKNLKTDKQCIIDAIMDNPFEVKKGEPKDSYLKTAW